MELRLATLEDLPQLKEVYRQIINDMDNQGIQIWDDIYPCISFHEDILKQRLFVFLDDSIIVAAFVLCEESAGEGAVIWQNTQGKPLYLERLGVNRQYTKKGIGSIVLQKAMDLAKERDATCLRLFVVDINMPAINLYKKHHFTMAKGTYDEIIDEELVFHELGFEITI